MKLAIVHDYLNQYGGAERIIEIFHEMFPEAPIYTSVFDPETLPPVFRSMDIRPSFMQRLPFVKRYLPYYLPFFPVAFEQIDLRNYDVILSSTTAWGKGIITSPDALHVCYCNTPMRFAWRYHDYMQDKEMVFPIRQALTLVLHPIRLWDVVSANYVDYFIANSYNISRRIAKFYRRESHVIHCPVDCSRYHISDKIDDYYLIVSRLREYKRVDVAIRAFNLLKRPLIVIGDGNDRARLQRMAEPHIRFLGRVDEETLQSYYARCRAFIFPGEEDFGLTPIEAQASGRPVIAFAKGGALETVVDGKTGRLFYPQTPEALAEAVREFDSISVDPAGLRAHAMQFDVSHFKQKIRAYIDACITGRTSCSVNVSGSFAS
ncbi:MAG: glycosyltransferase [candidate division Zixibacteria bacterium]|nr:glycosyltransferase [candidate division Zixibacteria bacterium]